MSVKLKAGSMELEAAFIEWLRSQGYNPVDGIDPFFSGSEFVRSQLKLIHDGDRAHLLAEARKHLERRCRDAAFVAQFPLVHGLENSDNRSLRYTVTLILSDVGAEWVGRVWDERGYVGEISGSHAGAHANYAELARGQIESQIRAQDLANRTASQRALGART
ncbi:hypothetical protein DT603_06565 [Pseudoxanthomonas gei]|uniref:Uncharacterized protein n=1 Tax=Pseudoxanthomonas gei TaxID=1383030 RepID=A0ABX0AAE6_9GAMM|nr:hypothetical protein [Pseudoxanthomonas gei]NDK38504.1 hypothetical protein [Pseudoxanthomonas gei]